MEERFETLQVTHEELKISLTKAIKDQERFANRRREDTPTLEPGDQVWLNAKNIVSTRPSRKLDYKRLGPFEVKRVINPVAFELTLPPWMKIHPVFHVSLLEKVKVNQSSDRHQTNPPPKHPWMDRMSF